MKRTYVCTQFGPRETDLLMVAGGLAVTRCLHHPKDEEASPPEEWNITHVNSGMGVAKGFREDTARSLAQQIATLADWGRMTFHQAACATQDKTLRPKIEAAVAKARREDSE